ncbi:hypothetical protein KIPB_007839 [Kipferlia bialata]|uniref:Uncharacterized protein n=1 Tax=Kipferlia bialata TaxID=797122 RepID=A0A9K3D0M8_9EUKA|nr:hypothetical protein KIPB_007839 [Kipferlia bialata]|eukprot:g7839.t1
MGLVLCLCLLLLAVAGASTVYESPSAYPHSNLAGSFSVPAPGGNSLGQYVMYIGDQDVSNLQLSVKGDKHPSVTHMWTASTLSGIIDNTWPDIAVDDPENCVYIEISTFGQRDPDTKPTQLEVVYSWQVTTTYTDLTGTVDSKTYGDTNKHYDRYMLYPEVPDGQELNMITVSCTNSGVSVPTLSIGQCGYPLGTDTTLEFSSTKDLGQLQNGRTLVMHFEDRNCAQLVWQGLYAPEADSFECTYTWDSRGASPIPIQIWLLLGAIVLITGAVVYALMHYNKSEKRGAESQPLMSP